MLGLNCLDAENHLFLQCQESVNFFLKDQLANNLSFSGPDYVCTYN